jgi:hypothetical protein
VLKLIAALVLTLGACGGVFQRFPDEVQAAVAHDDMRRLETERFIIYYPAHRRAEIDRFLIRADRCAILLREAAPIHDGPAADKMVIVMPETAFNNAFVAPELLGVEAVSVIPTMATLDFTTEFGLIPDPGFIGCHEIVHYVHLEQIGGFWKFMDRVFGHLYTPQALADPWFLEGLATHYEAKLSPGVGRPTWPIFTGMFAAAYAGKRIRGGDLSELGRRAPVGQHYLVGTMFVRFLSERYGEQPAWAAIADQATAIIGWFFPRTFREGYGVSLGGLIEQFNAWHARTFPVRARPATQRRLATLGNDARYARGRDGTEAWVTQDVDVPPRLVVRDPDGRTVASVRLLDMIPPRTLVDADPLLVSGFSITADGREVWLTIIDRATTAHVPRLLRWRRGEDAVTELSHTLGPGATIDPTGGTYYYCAVDGDRWSLAAWDVRRGTRRVLVDVAPGTYVLGAQVSPDGTRLIANVWDGNAFVAWVLDAATGARRSEIRGAGTPVWDASFTDDARAMYLGVVDARFQVFVEGRAVSDVPYAALAARSARGTIRFLNREGWRWTLDEVATPAPPLEVPAPVAAAAVAAVPATATGSVIAVAPDPAAGAPVADGSGTVAPSAGTASPTPGTVATTPAVVATTTPGTVATTPVVVATTTPGAVSTTPVVVATTPAAVAPTTPGAAPTTPGAAPTPPGAAPTPPGAAPGTPGAVGLPQAGLAPPGATPVLVVPPARAPVVQSDEAYSPWEHFFFPQIRSPTILVLSTGQPHYGIVLGGGDRLGLQRWGLEGYVQPRDAEISDKVHGGVGVSYLNSMLAPWQILASAYAFDWIDPSETDADDNVTAPEERRTRDLSLSLSRTWRDSLTTSLAGLYTDDYGEVQGEPGIDRKLGGPQLYASWRTGETTAYTGLHRGLFGSTWASYYPESLSSFAGDIYDVRALLAVVIPLPIGRRHKLVAELRGRALLAGDDTGLLQLGGYAQTGSVWSGTSVADEPPEFDDDRFPPNHRFSELLWGYEDYAITTDRAAIATAWWTYPLILDTGFASTLGFLPPTFLRQIDFTLFATAAIDQQQNTHAAFGGLATLRLSLVRLPLQVTYQLARRVRDDNAVTQLVSISVPM